VLRFPLKWQLRAILQQRFRGEFRRLAAFDDLLDDFRSQEGERSRALSMH